MGRESTLAMLVLTPDELTMLDRIRHSQTEAARDVRRAEVLFLYYSGETVAAIMDAVGMTRKSVSKWIKKALTTGVSAGLKDKAHGSAPLGNHPKPANGY